MGPCGNLDNRRGFEPRDEGSNPSGPAQCHQVAKMRASPLAFLLFFASISFPLFLAGLENGSIAILCEGQGEAFVTSPSGATATLPLDAASQAVFLPREQGPHTVQCGKDAKVVEAIAQAQAMAPEKSDATLGIAILAACGLLTIMALAAFVFFMLRFSEGKTQFCKHVEGKRARLVLRAGEEMAKVEISDPLFMGFPGEPLEFNIAIIRKGQIWSHEYEISEPSRALPASLRAKAGKGNLSLLSQLFIDGAPSFSESDAIAGMGARLRKLPKGGSSQDAIVQPHNLPKAEK